MNSRILRTTLACAAIATAPACMINTSSRTAQGPALHVRATPRTTPSSATCTSSRWTPRAGVRTRRRAHHSLVGAHRSSAPDAPDVTIVQATHEASSKVAKQAGRLNAARRRQHDGARRLLGRRQRRNAVSLIEDTSHQELERAKRHESRRSSMRSRRRRTFLEGRVKTDFDKYGTQKENEVAGEILATIDVIARLKTHAESEARESEDFVADLERALETASQEKAEKQVAARHEEEGPAADGSAVAAAPARRLARGSAAAAPARGAAAAETGGCEGGSVHAGESSLVLATASSSIGFQGSRARRDACRAQCARRALVRRMCAGAGWTIRCAIGQRRTPPIGRLAVRHTGRGAAFVGIPLENTETVPRYLPCSTGDHRDGRKRRAACRKLKKSHEQDRFRRPEGPQRDRRRRADRSEAAVQQAVGQGARRSHVAACGASRHGVRSSPRASDDQGQANDPVKPLFSSS